MTQEQIDERKAELKKQIVLLRDDMIWNEEKMGILLQINKLQHENKTLREKIYQLSKELEEQKNQLQQLHTEAAIRA